MELAALYEVFKRCGSICTDNRKVQPGQLFVALKGDKFDANDFAAAALESGAEYALVDKPEVALNHRYILVEDSLKALQDLAAYHRRQLKCPIVAIAGSNGKTTTKELAHAVLQTNFRTFATKGNLNNHIGVPLSLLSIMGEHELAIIEIGANHLGETAALSALVRPDMGLITNNGKDHLEGYGSIENVRKANGELYDYFRENGGSVFLYTDAFDLVEMADGLHVYTYGEGKENYVSGIVKKSAPYMQVHCTRPEMEIRTQLFGDYNLPNVLAAIALGQYFKVPENKIKSAIESYLPQGFRSRIVALDNMQLILDCYNANPDSMQAAIRSFAEGGTENKWLVLGDMLELGPYAEVEHAQMLDYVSELHFEKVLLVGPLFKQANAEYSFLHFDNSDILKEAWGGLNPEGKSVLLKGSRGIALEKAVEIYL